MLEPPYHIHWDAASQGTATPMNERERLGLRGLLPPRVVPMDVQLNRIKDGEPAVMAAVLADLWSLLP